MYLIRPAPPVNHHFGDDVRRSGENMSQLKHHAVHTGITMYERPGYSYVLFVNIYFCT